MLVEAAVADAYGAGREYLPEELTRKSNDLRTYLQHPKWSELVPGYYTDDTQMMIALAELLMSGSPLTMLDWADKVVDVFKRDPRAGYAGGFYALLQEVEDGTELLRRLQPHSVKNGGAMRAAPCGMLPNPRSVRDRAMWQASLTHATQEGMAAAAVSALLVYGCRHGMPKEELAGFVHKWVPTRTIKWEEDHEGRVLSSGLPTVHAALTAIRNGNTLSNVLWESVNFTGDVDTVAAIAVAAASTHPDIPNNLHSNLYDELENGEYGWDYLRELDKKLIAFSEGLDPKDEEPDEVDPSLASIPEEDQGVFALFEED